MQLDGVNPVRASRTQVWMALNDPDVLARCIPGVKSLTLENGTVYKMVLEVSVGPVKGKFDGKLEVLERQEPDQVKLSLQAKAPTGVVSAIGTVRLEELEGGVLVHWSGEPKLMGMLATLGARLVSGAAKSQAEIFFKKLEGEAQKIVVSG